MSPEAQRWKPAEGRGLCVCVCAHVCVCPRVRVRVQRKERSAFAPGQMREHPQISVCKER